MNVEPGSEDEFSAEILALIEAGRKVEAIKRMRERFSLDLAQAKEAVDRIQEVYGSRTVAPEPGKAVPKEQFEQEIVQLLEERRFLEAIRRYRDRYGTGLLESKQAVEQIASEYGLSPGGKAGGCSAALIFLFAVPAGCLLCLIA